MRPTSATPPCVTFRLAYKLFGDAEYVQPGLLSDSERARLDSMQLGPVAAEVAATSTKHRRAAAKRAEGGYVGVTWDGKRWKMCITHKGTAKQEYYRSPEEAARAYDARAWDIHGWCGSCLLCNLVVTRDSRYR